MAHDREEQNPQQTRGRNGVGSPTKKRKFSEGELPNQSRARGIRVGSHTIQQKISEGEVPKQTKARRAGMGSRTTQQKISEGEVPKQEGRNRGRPSSKLSELERQEKHKEQCRRYRKVKNAKFQKGQDFKNEFDEEFGPMTPKHLKEMLCKLGVSEEVLEEIRKSALSKELREVCQTLEDETPVQKKLFQDIPEENLVDGAEFSKFQQTEIKQKTMCDEFGVTEEGLEGRNLGKLRLGPLVEEKRAFNSIEEADKFLSEDDEVKLEEPSAEKKKRLTEIEEELQALIGSQSTTPGGKEAVMNEPNNQDPYLTVDYDGFGCYNTDQLPVDDDFCFCYDDFINWCNSDQCGTSFNGQSPMEVCEDAAMYQLPELQMDDDFISSLIFGEVQSQTLHQPKPVLADRVNEQNLMAPTDATKAWDKVGTSEVYKGTAGGKENAIGMMSMYQECTGKTSAAAGMGGGSKGATTCAPCKGSGSCGAGLVVPMEKIGHQKKGKKVAAAVQFR